MGAGFISDGYALAEYGGCLYAGGELYLLGTNQSKVVRWNGREWAQSVEELRGVGYLPWLHSTENYY